VNEITIFDLNMILQLVIFAFFLTGISYIKRSRTNLRKHRIFMAAAILLNLVSILLVMGRSFVTYFGILVERFYEFGSFVTWIHALVGGLAETLGIVFLLRHPRRILLGMRLTAVLWVTALILGLTFYLYYYIL